MATLTQEELKTIQDLNAEFAKAKTALGDLELQKQNVLQHIDAVRKEFAVNERSLIEKYGDDAIINIQTGEVTKKENQNDTK
jgi:hypothetical protein